MTIPKWLRNALIIFFIAQTLMLSGCALLLIGAGTGAYMYGRHVEKEENLDNDGK
ncbi:MAG: hypothetical protein AB1454_09875 [Candidatus Auribacterota bacterium]